MPDVTKSLWTEFLFGPALPAGGWGAISSGIFTSLFGLAAALILGTWAQRFLEQRRRRAAKKYLCRRLRAAIVRLAPFDQERRPVQDKKTIGKAFFALSNVDACIRWAKARSEEFDAEFFARILEIEERAKEASMLGPSSFMQPGGAKLDTVEASTHLWTMSRIVSNDLSFLLSED